MGLSQNGDVLPPKNGRKQRGNKLLMSLVENTFSVTSGQVDRFELLSLYVFQVMFTL